MSLRHAKDLFESASKMEREFKHLFNGKYGRIYMINTIANYNVAVFAHTTV